MDRFDRTYGALLGLALGDAVGYPALFHRMFALPERRRTTLWNRNRELMEQRISRLFLPFTHRNAPETLAPAPTDDTEWAMLSARAILDEEDGPPTQASFIAAWQRYVLNAPDQIVAGFSERAAIDNLMRGLRPPTTGNDNPQHYDDSGAVRAVISGLYYAGRPCEAADLAQADAEITHAEDGVAAARAMAVAIALLDDGISIHNALTRARAEFPPDSWLAYGDTQARACATEAIDPFDLALQLTLRVVNCVYSFGNAAPETLPAAFVLCEAVNGDLKHAIWLANSIPKAADSLPALVGALCGAVQGADAVSPNWRQRLEQIQGLCLPSLTGMTLNDVAQRFTDKSGEARYGG
jgi:ADP-ribosylglycohydrolase